ncbi:MAG: TetR/AcrR family transcriptional regulator [Firmicutes bacterium]|nr:TetR/AcrR family transcriptional regulator [Bacillota bacterium]
MPSSQFQNLPTEKQHQILEASLREFADKGYDLASTNHIVEQAGISKGVLFKYFDDKTSLFLSVCEAAFKDIAEAIQPVPCEDLFEFLKNVTLQKIQFSKERPLTYRLLLRIAKEPKHPMHAKVMDFATVASREYMSQLAALLPKERLREGLTWEHVLAVVTWISNGLLEKYIARMPDTLDEHAEEAFEPIVEDLDLYFSIIKDGIYKEDGQP